MESKQARSARRIADEEFDLDSQVDIAFGQWLKEKRISRRLSSAEASKSIDMPSSRLEALESGESQKGVTYSEAVQLAKLYQVDLSVVLHRATWSG